MPRLASTLRVRRALSLGALLAACASAQTRKPASSAPSPTLLITTNQACVLRADGVVKGTLEDGGVQTLKVQIGEHLIRCTAVDGPDVVEADVTISTPVQQVVKLDLKTIADARKKAELDKQQAQQRQQAADLRRQQAQQQREAVLHQFDGQSATEVAAWIARFADQHLQLFVMWSDNTRTQAYIGPEAIRWDEPEVCNHVTENGNDTIHYSNCVAQMPESLFVHVTSGGAGGVSVSGKIHVCYHTATVTETTTNRPFIGEQTSTRQTDRDECGDWSSHEFRIAAGDKATTSEDYHNLSAALQRLAVLARADLR